MIGEKNYLKGVKAYSNSYVTLCNGDKGNIIEKGEMDYLCLPCLDDVLLVKGFTINLISMSQLCDQYLCVNFNSSECSVTKKHLEQIMKGNISSHNFYILCYN